MLFEKGTSLGGEKREREVKKTYVEFSRCVRRPGRPRPGGRATGQLGPKVTYRLLTLAG
jgi:hypothetical protein